jgi:integrase
MPVYADTKTGRFFVKFTYKGQTVKRRLPEGTTKSEADKYEIKLKSELFFEAVGVAPRSDARFEVFAYQVFLPHVDHNAKASFDKAVYVIKASLHFFKGKTLRSIKPADIELFKASRENLLTMHGKRRAPATVARELAVVSKLFSLAVRNDLIDYNPCARVEKPSFDNVMDKVLRYEDEEKFFAAFKSDWCRDICKLILNTGLRQKDVLNLTKFNVDLENRELNLVQGKTKRRILVMLNQTALEIIERRMHFFGTLLFPSPKTGKIGTQTKTAIINACARAKMERLTIRDLRRTCGTRLEESGHSANTIAKFLGHSDMRSVHRYQRGRENLRKAVESLENRTKNAEKAKLRIAK